MNYLLAGLLLVITFVYESVFFTIHTNSIYELIKGMMYLVFILICLSGSRLKDDLKNEVVALYLILVLYLLIPAVLNGADGMLYWVKNSIKISYLLIFVMLFKMRGENLVNAVLNVFLWTGVFLGIQTIILFILVVSGHPPELTYLPRYDQDDLYGSYGIFGFANSISVRENVIGFRTQSFFSEATNFALFQFFPFFIALSRIRAGTWSKFAAMIILASIITTFSVSGIIGLSCGLVSFLVFGSKQRFNASKSLMLMILCPMIAIYGYFYVTNEDSFEKGSYQSVVLSKGEDSTTIRTDWTKEVFNSLSVQPLGVNYIEFTKRIGALPAAPIHWFLIGGYFGGLFMLFTQLLLFRKYYLRGLSSSANLERSISACCIATMITSVVHGQWVNLYYFLPIALLVWLRASHSQKQKQQMINGIMI